MKNKTRILFLDASSLDVQVGILCDGKWLAYFRSSESALQSVFQGIEVCLGMAKIKFEEITDFAYCEGPGSLLGIRVVAMAIRAWKQQEMFKDAEVYAYNSFEIAVKLIKKIHNPEEPFVVIAPSRRGFWNIMDSKGGRIFEGLREDLKSFWGRLWLFKQKKLFSSEEGLKLKIFDYSFEHYPEIFSEVGVLRALEEPEALFIRETEYVKWDEKRHGMEE